MSTVCARKNVDIYTRVTSQIVEAIEAGTKEFKMPWHIPANTGLPRNVVTQKAYRGINILVLWAVSTQRGFGSRVWASYRQWQSLGAQVKRGEHGQVIVFYRKREDALDEVDDQQEDPGERKFILRHTTVFNGDQVEGWGEKQPAEITELDRNELAELFIQGVGADVHYGCGAACYMLDRDEIHMPHRRQFVSTGAGSALEGFYAVLLHEHIHWTGHLTRLNRDLSGRFGSDAYAMEELVAELGAAFLSATLGLSAVPRPDHAAYVSSWLRVLKNNKTAIFNAASAATKACDYLGDLFRYANSAYDRLP